MANISQSNANKLLTKCKTNNLNIKKTVLLYTIAYKRNLDQVSKSW